uniref:phospholipase A2 n=1 Tax=Glossina brevipalpis TaxID=37001 RepID=A0A1A9W9K3_9MUSC
MYQRSTSKSRNVCEHYSMLLKVNSTPKTNKTLTELVLCGARPMGPLFGDLVQCLPNLTTLDLDCDERITGEEMEYVFRYLINLRHLILDRCVGENDIKYVPSKANISNLERLQILDSCWCPIKVLQISNLNFEFRELKTLRLTSCRKADSVLNAVDFKKYFPALERLLSGDLPDDLHRYYENLFIDAWETRTKYIAANYDDLGSLREADMCSRGHDDCKDVIMPDLSNCEQKFINCLQEINSPASNSVGHFYFVGRNKCFQFGHPIVECTKYQQGIVRKRCVVYKIDAYKSKIWQLYDIPFYTSVGEALNN